MIKYATLSFCFITFSIVAFAQPGGGGPGGGGPPVPITGIEILIGSGMALGIRRFLKRKKL